ncbi:hypothetical protein JI664_19630 [Rhodobacter sp. NTK016B]|uniref:DUF7742 family protein n=1 Tax=Rhodobacter sp. NTK016B TaxID=2759676 RepID=UPI001A8FC77A|nr:hypothetical protein [Rhodobacter sp. NTK016B]MBN8294192.1 hypothetical protein [Rhodobacter sp. NTK016B]
MRPVTLTDIAAAARVLLALPEGRRRAGMAALIARAERAEHHRVTTGRCHPLYGNGTLLSAALAHPARDPPYDPVCDRNRPGASDYLACLALVTEALCAHHARR